MAETHATRCKFYFIMTIFTLTASNAKRVKLGMLYSTLGNFDASFRSRVDTISLLAISQRYT